MGNHELGHFATSTRSVPASEDIGLIWGSLVNPSPLGDVGFLDWPSPGDICFAEIPFTGGSGSKIRPVLVIGVEARDLIVLPITSHPPRTQSDLELEAGGTTGLIKSGCVRCSRITSISRSLVDRVTGYVSPEDWVRITAATSKWLAALVSQPRLGEVVSAA